MWSIFDRNARYAYNYVNFSLPEANLSTSYKQLFLKKIVTTICMDLWGGNISKQISLL